MTFYKTKIILRDMSFLPESGDAFGGDFPDLNCCDFLAGDTDRPYPELCT